MLRGYKQGFSTHHASVKLIESWRQSLDQAGYHGADLNDLLKAFHKLNYDPLIENFHVYGFSKESLKRILYYPSDRWKRFMAVSVLGLSLHSVSFKVLLCRSSRPQVFLRKGALKICSKFTGEHPCRSAISIKLLCN